MSKWFSLFLISAFLSFPTGSAFADTVCQPVYGGGQNCITSAGISINKRVLLPTIQKATNPNDCSAQNTEFVENLTINDSKFSPDQSVIFQICVRNTGGETIQQVSVKDTFPGFVVFVSGNGVFDNNTKTLTFTTDKLAPNEVRPFLIQVKVASDVPNGVTCVVNQVTATANTGPMSQDNTSFCIAKNVTKGGFPVFPPPQPTVTPPTGPELIPLVSLLPGGLAGWLLRKKSNKLSGGEK